RVSVAKSSASHRNDPGGERNRALLGDLAGFLRSNRTLVCVQCPFPSVNARRKPRPPCRCCEVALGILGDPNLGRVCVDCYHELTKVRWILKEIGPLIGIGPCSNEMDS